MVVIGYVSALIPLACGAIGVVTGAFAFVVAVCIAVGDRMEGLPISRATKWSFGLLLLLPVWILLLRAMYQ